MAIELLAPAGSVEALRAACIAGADAVYIGGNRYGARAYAENPETEELLEAIRLIHRLGKKLYLTVNTLMKDSELEELGVWMKPFYEQGIDAVIVQDYGAVRLFREMFPDLPVHASTQMTVTGPDGVRLLQKLGISRVVPARELSLDELKRIRKETGIELETFIHGALCYSYSGQCLMSSMIGGRSGNRGRCAGICRLPYRTECGADSGKRELYPLNMKDLCTLHLIPQLIEAGISSFKIEGRMKKPEYTAGTVAVYRRAVDAYLNGSWEEYDSRKDKELLTDLYNRDGFTDGYYFRHNSSGMIALENEKLKGKRAEAARKAIEGIRDRLNGKEAEKCLQMPLRGSLRLYSGEQGTCTLTADLSKKGFQGKNSVSVKVSTDILEKARNTGTDAEQIRSQFMKTGGSPFRFEDLKSDIGPDVFVPVRLIKNLRRSALKEMEKAVTEEYSRCSIQRKEPADRTSGSSCLPDRTARGTGHPDIYASVLTEQQAEALLSSGAGKILYAVCLPPELAKYAEKLKENNMKTFLALPYVCRQEKLHTKEKAEKMLSDPLWDGILVRNLEEAGLIVRLQIEHAFVPGEVILDASLYTMNCEAVSVFKSWGFQVRTLPYELNFHELRRQNTEGSQLVVYGRTPMMISSQCVRKTMGSCSGKTGWTGITDRTGRRFPVYSSCGDCFNVIYNSLPTSLLREYDAVRHLHCGSVRMDFTDETSEQVVRIIEEAGIVFGRVSAGNTVFPDLSATRGHFRRGIE